MLLSVAEILNTKILYKKASEINLDVTLKVSEFVHIFHYEENRNCIYYDLFVCKL